jgi:CheY-like chemotaxis protein
MRHLHRLTFWTLKISLSLHSSAAFAGNILHILVVEDNAAFQMTIPKQMMNFLGSKQIQAKIEIASTGEEAIIKMRSSINNYAFDIVVMDFNLGPEIKNGAETVRAIKEDPLLRDHLPFFIGNSDNEEYNRMIVKEAGEGISTWIHKNKLRTEIEAALTQYQNLIALDRSNSPDIYEVPQSVEHLGVQDVGSQSIGH